MRATCGKRINDILLRVDWYCITIAFLFLTKRFVESNVLACFKNDKKCITILLKKGGEYIFNNKKLFQQDCTS